jgi:hypothetical protein
LDSLGQASGKIIGDDIMLEEMKSGKKDKEKEKEKTGGSTTPEFSESSGDASSKPRMRIKKLQLDSGYTFFTSVLSNIY